MGSSARLLRSEHNPLVRWWLSDFHEACTYHLHKYIAVSLGMASDLLSLGSSNLAMDHHSTFCYGLAIPTTTPAHNRFEIRDYHNEANVRHYCIALLRST